MRTHFKFACAALALMPLNQLMAADRSRLPIPEPQFDGLIKENVIDSRPDSHGPVKAPAGAPNVLLFMSDDVGFAMSSTFGGPVPTPNMTRLAMMGQRYNRFHTTGICSPSRAALLTGRNHHVSGVGYISDLPADYPGYGGRILPETATVAETMRLNGYNTAMFGKHHNVPTDERSAAGPFAAWPTAIGFEYFLGFSGGDTDQYSPNLFRGISRVAPDEGQGAMLDQRLADEIIAWVHNQKAAAPDKPFLIYWAPGSTHAPHQAPAEYVARFKGKFDQGWDKLREEVFRNQLAGAIIPQGTKLTGRPAEIPAWDTLKPSQKAFAARTMEVAAAQLVFQDEQLGRVINELERMGALDNTLVAIIIGDNGASGEGGPNGTINELRSVGTNDERESWLQANTDRLGGPMTYANYPAGFGWAMNTPFRGMKQFASMLGGIRNGMIMYWKGHVERPGSVCSQFGHLVDITPTLLDAARLPAPQVVNGVRQAPLDGQSLLPSLSTCDSDKPRTQYFEVGGKVGLYHDGWFLSGDDGRPSWENLPPTGARPKVNWALYDLDSDFSQSTDLSRRQPARLKEMMNLWRQEATRNHVFPLDHRFGAGRIDLATFAKGRKHFDFWGKGISLPALGGPLLLGRSFTLNADLVLGKSTASGVVVALGSRFGGWSLFLDKGHPAFVFARSTDPKEIEQIRSDQALPAGRTSLQMRFAAQAHGKGFEVILSSDGRNLARLKLETGVLKPAGSGETLDVGYDLGVPVTNYAVPQGMLEGDISHVGIDFD